ncbi:MAG: hypothetical protein Q4D52_06950, partial [Eubacteriales bacterium]|nr:hypothetical protein [Eubacteriales bacterium]
TDPDLYNDNVQVTVKGHGDITRTGATFIGWSFVKKDLIAKLADQPNNLLKANDKFNIKVDTTLYAIWAIDIKGPNGGGSDGVPDYLQRSITYNGNGNTGGT